MNKTISLHGVDYDTAQLLLIKGQGTKIRTDRAKCIVDEKTIETAEVNHPIVVQHGAELYAVFLPVTHKAKEEANFAACLLSKHILKKARVDTLKQQAYQPPVPVQDNYRPVYRSREDNDRVRNNMGDRFPQGGFRRDTVQNGHPDGQIQRLRTNNNNR